MVRLKKMISVFAVCVILFTMMGCSGGFDASGYTEAILDLQFQGDIKNARTLVAGATQEELDQMYQEFIDHFVAGYITDGMNITDDASEEFKELAAAIFASMRYEVGEASETGKKEYEVPVVIQPIFTVIISSSQQFISLFRNFSQHLILYFFLCTVIFPVLYSFCYS